MQHLDPELLSLLALDDGVGTDSEREHLRRCTACRTEYEELRRTVSVARTQPPQTLQAPGPQVWAAIHRELGLAETLAEDPLGGNVRDIRSAPPPRPGTAGGRRPRRARPLWLLAAAAALVLVLGIGWIVSRQAAAPPAPLAVATLEPLKQFTTTGSAEVLPTGGNQRELVVRLSADEAHGYQEVWLIKPDLSGLVSLGVLESTTGTFAIPPGLNLADYPIVDVSDEPLDGKPAHSGVSIVRGKLDV
ncbi:anti-sigma factor [Arthrobacter sp. I2-34]|uniref:Anti-sigma factor n=1 Tax=Arthrobacter hankyongi TaxID=2904801 RepID=A0ABS9L5T0_9MICC|nr:anti-sigma factor [Arthrobacter hankyongi]MCG2622037.1 anti-sigma factor [Arthrobacter hankyongi]